MRTRRTFLCLALAGVVSACAGSSGSTMTRERMERLIAGASRDFQGSPGAVQFRHQGVGMACISDVSHDRMRIVAPVTSRAEVGRRELDRMLVANYHSSLDARYAVSEGVVYAAFLHPLSSLTDAQLLSALRQVASLARTFGSTYSSGQLLFGEPAGQPL